MLAHVAPGRRSSSGHRASVRAPAGASLACLDELQQLLQYLQVGKAGRQVVNG